MNERLQRIERSIQPIPHTSEVKLDTWDLDYLFHVIKEQQTKLEKLGHYVVKLEHHCDDWDFIERHHPEWTVRT